MQPTNNRNKRGLTPFKKLALLCIAALVTSPAYALFDDNEARQAIVEIRTQNAAQQKENNRRLESVEQQAGRAQIENANQIEALRREIAALRGNVELLQQSLAETQRRLRDIYADLDARVKKFEPQKVVIDDKEAEINPDELRSYNAALEAFRAGKFAEAGNAFNGFLRQYPRSIYVPLAQFWQGSAWYAAREFKVALPLLQSFASTHPNHARAPDALFNAGNSQIELNDKKAARVTFQALMKQYPDSAAAQAAREKMFLLK